LCEIARHGIDLDNREERVGSNEHDGDGGVTAFDVLGRPLGTFPTSLEAASACLRPARLPRVEKTAASDHEELFRAIRGAWTLVGRDPGDRR
jgi:hypothetical protein